MNGESKTTTNHEEIRAWATDRGGRAVSVKHDPLSPNGSSLGIDFLREKYNDDLQEISWEQFFDTFDREGLVLVYQTETEGGKLSRFGRIVKRNEVEQAVIE